LLQVENRLFTIQLLLAESTIFVHQDYYSSWRFAVRCTLYWTACCEVMRRLILLTLLL